MLRVFISYRQSDGTAAADAVVAALRRDDHHVFRDSDGETGGKLGDELVRLLYGRMDACDVVVAIVSPQLVDSKWCFAELMIARALGKRVVPVVTSPGATHPLIEDTVLATAFDVEGVERLRRELSTWDPGGSRRWDWKRGTPYPGLRGFGENDEAAFFGRGDDLRRLRDRLELPRAPRRLVCLAGASGSGKSSLVRAGLVPAIRRDRSWIVAPVVTIDQASPLEALAIALELAGRELDPASQLTDVAIAARWTPDEAPRLVRDLVGTSGRRLLLCLDQFEQLFLSGDAREQLMRPLLAAASRPLTPFHLVITMRIDYVERFFEAGGVEDDVVLLGPLRGARMLSIITEPARAADLAISTELAARMVQDADGPDGLPLLSAVLHEMTAGLAAGQRIEAAQYRGVADVLGRLADAAIGDLEATPHDAIMDALMRLVSVDESGVVVRRRVRAVELDEPTRAILEAFAARRLVVIDRDTYDVAHEALFRAWKPLTDAIRVAGDRLRLEGELRTAAARWDHAARPSNDYLWGGDRLARAESWLAVQPSAAEVVRAFITASRRQDIDANRALATTVALSVETELANDPELALAVLLEAERQHGWSPALQRVTRAILPRARLLARITPRGCVPTEALSVDISSDGTLIAAVFAGWQPEPEKLRKKKAPNRGPTCRLAGVYDLRAGEWIWCREHPGARLVRFSSGGLVLVTADAMLTFDVEGVPSRRPVPCGDIADLRFATDADIAVTLEDGRMVVRSASTLEIIRVVDDPVTVPSERDATKRRRFVVAPDGRAAMSYGVGDVFHLWPLDPSFAITVEARIDFSSDGMAVPADLWKREPISAAIRFETTGSGPLLHQPDASLALPGIPVAVAIDASGTIVASAIQNLVLVHDRSARIAAAPFDHVEDLRRDMDAHVGILRKHADDLWPQQAPPWIRAADERVLVGGPGTMADGRWPDGPCWPGTDVDVHASGCGPVTVHAPKRHVELPIRSGVLQAVVGDDARRLYVARERELEIWDLDEARLLRAIVMPMNGPLLRGGMIVARGGRYVATTFAQGTSFRTFIRDLDSDALLNARGRLCAFSPDGSCAVSSDGAIAYIFPTAEPHERSELCATYGVVFDLAWSPDGAHIAAATENAGVLVFDVETRHRIAAYPTIAAGAVTFANATNVIAATESGDLVRIELLDSDGLRAMAQSRVHLQLTEKDRERYGVG